MNENAKALIIHAINSEYHGYVAKAIQRNKDENPGTFDRNKLIELFGGDSLSLIERVTYMACGITDRHVGRELLKTGDFDNGIIVCGEFKRGLSKKLSVILSRLRGETTDERMWFYHRILIIRHIGSNTWLSISPSNFERKRIDQAFHIIEASSLKELVRNIEKYWISMDWPNSSQIQNSLNNGQNIKAPITGNIVVELLQ